jgi:hexosaminidase
MITDLNSMHRRLKVISSRLEEVGITHIRNKDLILRNITNYQDTKALNDFTNICEPLKNYKRNGGGKKVFYVFSINFFLMLVQPMPLMLMNLIALVNILKTV